MPNDPADPALNSPSRSSCDPLAQALHELLGVMARLRDPVSGCPWDLQQTFASIAPYTIEEAYEVADAILREDLDGLKEELGDLLFQVVFHARLAQEQGLFDFVAVAQGLSAKLMRRHPHVFSGAPARDAEEQAQAWEAQKAAERAAKGDGGSVLDAVPLGLASLTRAEKLTKRAARIGFDWPDPDAVLEKLAEELAELEEARAIGDPEGVCEEVGDVLFVIANLARKLGVDPEDALRRSNAKFSRRFRHVEASARQSGEDGRADLETLEAWWREAKSLEKQGGLGERAPLRGGAGETAPGLPAEDQA